MPVIKCSNGKYRIGSGECIYDSKEKANRAYMGYLGSKYGKMAKGGLMDTKMNMFVPISKLNEELRMVYGVATCSKLDNQNEIVDYNATKDALKDYSEWRNIREMHKPSAVGTAPILELRDNNQELYIGAKIIDDQAWEKCKEGVYKGFSIGGEVLDRKLEMDKASGKTVNRVTKYLLNEISVVDRPANPACKFQTVKRDTSVHTVTISDDPLRDESSKVMEKAFLLAKRVLSKQDLEDLPDENFGLIKVIEEGNTLIKHRSYPMPDKTHAVNMIRKMSKADELSDKEKERIHETALFVLGKKHIETECPYCITKKISQGGAEVSKKVEKQVTITDEPQKKTVTLTHDKPADEVNPSAMIENTGVEDEATADVVVPEVPKEEEAPVSPLEAKLDRMIDLLASLLQAEQAEAEAEAVEDVEEEVVSPEEPVIEEKDKTLAEEEELPVKEDAELEEEVPVKDEEEAEEMEAELPVKEDEKTCCAKTVKPIVKKMGLVSMRKVHAILEPLKKENAELRNKIAKMEKEPLPRKEAKAGDKPQKVEKYQQVKLEKKEGTFTDELSKDIEKASSMRKSGKELTSEEDTFCKRVAERMLEEKLSK